MQAARKKYPCELIEYLLFCFLQHKKTIKTGRTTTLMNSTIFIVFLLLYSLASVCSFSTLPVVAGTNELRRPCFGHICDENKRTVYEYYNSPRKLSPIVGSSIELWAIFRRQRDDRSDNDDDDKTGNTKRLPGSNFFRRSGPRSDSNSNSNSSNARRKNTIVKNGTTYFPSGLSRAEYSELKRRETEKERDMDFGAWGPRFARGGPPRGDWMAMPNLWTMGKIGNNSSTSNSNDHSNRLVRLYRRLQLIIRGYGPAFLLGYVFIDCMYSGYAVWRFKQIRDVSILSFIIGLRPVQQQIIQPAIIKIATKSVTVVSLTALKLQALKIALAMLQIPLWNILMERANRRWLWSKRRFVVVVGSTVTLALTIFGSAMLR